MRMPLSPWPRLSKLIISISSRIIGEDKALSIKIGEEAGAETADFILVRGASADVDRAVKEIYEIVENAKNDIIDNSYVRVSNLQSVHVLT